MGDLLKLSLRFDFDGQIGWQLVIGLKKTWNCRDIPNTSLIAGSKSVIRTSNFSAKSKILGISEGNEYFDRMHLLVLFTFASWGLKLLSTS